MKKLLIVKLVGATAVSALSAWFVHLYTNASDVRFLWEHQQHSTMNGAVFLQRFSTVGYAMPVLIGILGFLCVLRKRNQEVMTELVVWFAWLASLAWIGLALFVWQIANVPVFHGGGNHY